MPRYPFSATEQEVIRELGLCGYRYAHETKKVIEFRLDVNEKSIFLNREHNSIALVFGFGDPSHISRISGVRSSGDRASSNFATLSEGVTSTGKLNHQGTQVLFDSTASIPAVVDALSR